MGSSLLEGRFDFSKNDECGVEFTGREIAYQK